jgi:hypothetical protein
MRNGMRTNHGFEERISYEVLAPVLHVTFARLFQIVW